MKNTIANLLFSGSAFGISANLTTEASFFDSSDPIIIQQFSTFIQTSGKIHNQTTDTIRLQS